MSDSSASTNSQQSLPLQAQSKAQNVVRKPMRRPVGGSVSSLPASPQNNTVSNPQELESPAPELAGPFAYGSMQPVISSWAFLEPMSQRSSISESPSYTGAQEHNAFSSCRLCNHCKSGIPYDVPYFRCRFCQYYFCNNCHGAHPSSHQQSLVRMLSRRTLPDTTRFEKNCCQCLKPVHCRHDCQECSICFCDDCFLSKEGSHEHSSFNSSEAPCHHLKISDDVRDQECCTTPVISHCSRCSGSQAIAPTQYAFMCKTCLFKFDATVKFCQPCYTESWYSHDQTHECITVVRQPVPNDAQTGLGCSQCDRRFPSLNRMTLDQHPHNAYISFMGPRAREAAVHTEYRSCQRKRFREDQPQVTLECARCKLEFLENTMRICAGPCDGTFCDQCFPHASVNHIHGLSNFRSTSDEARPEIGFLPAGWRALQNLEGRTYYLEEQTKKFTFDKPQVPNTLPPGWQSMLDGNGKPYYLDHNTRSSTYVSPVYGTAPVGYELRQTNTGRLYYVNRKTQAATWHKPLPINEKLPAGWEAGQHADGRIYYINHLAKKTQWTKPTSPARAPAQSPQPLRHAAPAPHQAIPRKTSAGHTSAPVGAVPARPSGQAHQPPHPAPYLAHATPHNANPAAHSGGHATAGPRPGAPPHRPATTTSAGPRPGAQHTAPAPHTTAPAHRPPMPSKVASAPAETNKSNIRTSLNALALNQNAQKVALGLGLSVFKAAVAPDLNLGSTDVSNVDIGSTNLGVTDFSSVDFSGTDTGAELVESSLTQDSYLGGSFDPTATQADETLVVQESNTDQYTYTMDTLSPNSTAAISPPFMSPTDWTDPSNPDASTQNQLQNQGQGGYGIAPFIGHGSSRQNHSPAIQNAQHQNFTAHNAQHHNSTTHNAQQHNSTMYNHNGATYNAQQHNNATQNSQHHNPVTHNAHPENKPTNIQNPNAYPQQNYQAVNDQGIVYITDGTENQSYSVTQTETIDVPNSDDPSEMTEATYVDTTTYTVEDDGSTDTVDYSFVSSQDFSSDN